MNKYLKCIGIALLGLILGSSIQPVCNCSYMLPDRYLSRLKLTEDPNIISAVIYNISKWPSVKLSDITIDLEALSISAPLHPPNVIGLGLNKTQQGQSSRFIYDSNKTQWILTSQNNTILINVSLNIRNETEKRWFVNPILNHGYLVLEDSNVGNFLSNATVFAVEFETNLVTRSTTMWDFLGDSVIVYADEGLVASNAGCCYCVNHYYYRFTSDYKLEFLATTYLWTSKVIDTRTHRLIMVHSTTNTLEIIYYDSHDPIFKVKKRFSLEEIDASLLDQTTSNSTSTSLTSPTVTTTPLPIFPVFLSLVLINLNVLYQKRPRK
ncbi:MAG: hypothetical protein ACFFB5_21855 [Promethearchaeota archaeon]